MAVQLSTLQRSTPHDMPLTKAQKQEALGAIEETLDGANTVYLTDYQGLTVE